MAYRSLLWTGILVIGSDDYSDLFNKKSVLETKYRPLSLINTDQMQTTFSESTDQNLKMFSKKCKTENMSTVSNRIVQCVYFDIILVESNPIYRTFLNLQNGE